MSKSFFNKAAETLLAPYRVMDPDGEDPYRHTGNLSEQAVRRGLNFLNLPRTKAFLFVAFMASSSMAVEQKHEKLLTPFAIALASSAMLRLNGKVENVGTEDSEEIPVYYIDRNPGHISNPDDITPAIEEDLEFREADARFSIGLNFAAAAGVSTVGACLISAPEVGLIALPFGTQAIADYYRAGKALSGEWKILEQAPPESVHEEVVRPLWQPA